MGRAGWTEFVESISMKHTIKNRVCILRQYVYPQEQSLRREALALSGAGFEVEVLCGRWPGQKTQEIVDGIRVYRIAGMGDKGGILNYVVKYLRFSILATIKLTVRHLQSPFALVQVNTMPDFLVFATIVTRLLGARVGLMMYEPMPELWASLHGNSWMVKLLQIVQQQAIRYADVVFAVTEQQREKLVSGGGNAGKIEVILNSPDTGFLEPFSHLATLPQGRFTLICHGAIEERYGHDTMLDAVQRVKGEIPGLRLRIMGRGTYADRLQAKIEAAGLSTHVQYLGWVSVEQMAQEIASADVGIVAQESSPYSNLVHTGKMYDYLAFGKPVIASRLDSVRAYFGEDALRYFEPNDSESLAEAILDLYRHPEKRRALVENSQKLYGQFNWEQQQKVYLAAYHRLLRREGELADYRMAGHDVA